MYILLCVCHTAAHCQKQPASTPRLTVSFSLHIQISLSVAKAFGISTFGYRISNGVTTHNIRKFDVAYMKDMEETYYLISQKI